MERFVDTLGSVARRFFSRKQPKPSATNRGEAPTAVSKDTEVADEAQPKGENDSSADAPAPETPVSDQSPREDGARVQEPVVTPSPSDESVESVEGQEGDEGSAATPSPTFEDTVDGWSSDMVDLLRKDAGTFVSQRVRLEDVHPGGIAQLYVDHVTRLDTLVRERTALNEVSSKVNALLDAASKQKEMYGAVDVHLAIGTATWDGLGGADVPVLLRRVNFDVADDGTVTLQLLPGVEVNSRLLGALASAGAEVDTEALGDLMRGPEGFLPGTAFDHLRVLGESLDGFELREEHVLGMYSHPAGSIYRKLQETDKLAQSPIVRALAGDPDARQDIGAPQIEPNPYDRDPWREVGLGDQTPQVLDIVENVAEGGSLIARVNGRDIASSTTASFAAAIAKSGRSVLVLTNGPRFCSDLMDVFDDTGVTSVVANFTPQGNDQDIAQRLLDAALSEELVETDRDTEEFRTELKRSRETLSGYTEALHQPFPPWNVSAFQALQALTDLTSLPNPPATQVRLPKVVLSQISSDGGEETRELLARASELGLFTKRAEVSAWDGVEIAEAEEIGPILSALGRLTDEILPAMRMQMSTTAARCDLRQASTLRLWKEQLDLLARVRANLDIFKQDALERSPADMVVATAPKQWRKSKNINLKRSRRRDLVRQARDLVRPGVHVEDLHEALVGVQSVRLDWSNQSDRDSWPTVPDSIDELEETWRQATVELDVLRPYLEPVYGDLDAIYVEELATILERLYQEPERAKEVPELGAIQAELRERGLEPLVEDFRARGVDGESLALELDLAWWASALSFMLSSEPRLGGFDPEGLQECLARTQELDALQVASLGPELVRLVRARGWESLGLYPQQRSDLISALQDGVNPLDLFATSNLPWDLMPIVVAAPSQAAALVRSGRSVDAVIVAGLRDLPVAVVVPILASADQSVVVENTRPAPGEVTGETLGTPLPVVEIEPEQMPTGQLAYRILSSLGLADSHVAVPTPASSGTIRFVKVQGTGMPAPGSHAIESSKDEVDAVVELVMDHLRDPDGKSLAVVTFSERHAERIRTALTRAASADPQTEAELIAAGGAEDIVMFPADLAVTGADEVIISVGFAKTPHGRVIHDFGVLSTDDGIEWMENLGLGVGDEVTVISTLSADDIDESRLHHKGEKVLLDLLKVAGELSELEDRDQTEIDMEPEQLLTDLAERLHRLGLNVVPNLGVEGGMQIPLAIGHPEVPDELLVAILTDNEAYMDEPSQRIRNRHWTKRLESLGWKVRTVLSMSVFIDPNREARKIVDLTLDAVDEYYARVGLPLTPAAAEALGMAEIDEEPQPVAAAIVEDDSAETAADPHEEAAEAELEADDVGILDVESQDILTLTEEALEGAPLPFADSVGEETVIADAALNDEEETEEEQPDLFDQEQSDEGADVEDEDSEKPTVSPESDEEGQVPTDAHPDRGPRPVFARGLPLAAYSDDQLDELALWIRSDDPEASDKLVQEELRELLGITRRGAQTDAVLKNVARRTRNS